MDSPVAYGLAMVRGTIINAVGTPNPHDFTIEDEDGRLYFAHLGDLFQNEEKLYGRSTGNTVYLHEGDKVEFQPVSETPPMARAIHVRKLEY